MLLSGLPEQITTFDVVTHCRGGLVLRNLVEGSKNFGDLSRRFKLGRAVLVASPNEGTPLATPKRWDETLGWLAYLLTGVQRITWRDRKSLAQVINGGSSHWEDNMVWGRLYLDQANTSINVPPDVDGQQDVGRAGADT